MTPLTPLPIDAILPELNRALAAARSAVLVAPPGAGKTTRVPPALFAANLVDPKNPHIVMLQPRRVAARAAAQRIAEENGWELGRQVGYQVRFERVMTDQTPIRVVTEGILTRQLLDDPFLEGVGAVLLDEFHERSIHTDLAISLLREVRENVRPDLIVLVMSATLHAEPVAKFLGDCPIIRSPGRMFEVSIEYRPPSSALLEDRVAAEVRQILSLPPEESGDVLVFLPGAKEIRWTQERLDSVSRDNAILPLYGSLPFEEQIRALQPNSHRKVILATNIAETSLTIPGVRTVIDSGLARQAAYDARRGLDQLQLERISQASADQRAGRAGRVAAGRCIRLWTAKEQASLEKFDRPDIQRIDLAGPALALHSWGKSDLRNFGWYESPPEKSLAAAERLLWMLGALKSSGIFASPGVPGEGTRGQFTITPLGRRMASLPVHPRLARLLLAAADEGLTSQGAALAALLSERDAMTDTSPTRVQGSSDLLIRLDQVSRGPGSRLKNDLERMVRRISPKRQIPPDESALLQLILLAYPDRVARRRAGDPEAAVMVGGGGLRLARESVVRTAEFFIAVEARQDDRSSRGEAMVRLASAIEPAWLEECFPGSVVRTVAAKFDEKRRRVVGTTRTCYLDLVLSEQSDAAVDSETAGKVLAAALASEAITLFATNDQAAGLLARIEFLRKWMPEHPWPTFDAAALQTALIDACRNKRSADELNGNALAQSLMTRLPYPLNRLLDQNAPESIPVPSGKQIRIQYDASRPPVLAVRLQELFGWKATPRLAGGRTALVLELLGPNFRPVQVTDDLASFWANAYFQVRKDLKRRYPKHSWPDDPLTAPAEARGGGRRMKG